MGTQCSLRGQRRILGEVISELTLVEEQELVRCSWGGGRVHRQRERMLVHHNRAFIGCFSHNKLSEIGAVTCS